MDFYFLFFFFLILLEVNGFFLGVFGFFLKLLRLVLNITEATTKNQKWHKIGTNSVKSSFLPKKSLGQRPKPSAGPRSKPV